MRGLTRWEPASWTNWTWYNYINTWTGNPPAWLHWGRESSRTSARSASNLWKTSHYIDGILLLSLDALDRACSATSFDEPEDIGSDYNIDSGQDKDIPNGDNCEPVEVYRLPNKARVRGKNSAKNRHNRRRRILKKRVGWICGEVLWEEALSRTEGCTGLSISKQWCYSADSKRVWKINALFGFALIMPADASRFITTILTSRIFTRPS